MQTINFTELVHRFAKVPVTELTWLTPIDKLQSLIVTQSQQPEYLSNTFFDPNDFYIQGKYAAKGIKQQQQKQSSTGKQFVMGKKVVEDKKEQVVAVSSIQDSIQSPDEKKKNYKPGPFALFYQLNENKLQKDDQTWYYKDSKDIIGPVSSYNMDKMAYYKKIDDETKVAYKSVDKFVKFSKIRKIVDANRKEEVEE